MSREFEIRREVELPATPDEVWDAVATGAGTAAWLFPSGGDPEPRVGGKAPDGSTVTAWDPPNHFAVRYEGEDGFFNALEFVIEGRQGGTTVLRYAHSGIITDDWDNQYDAANQHTDFYLHTLGQYLEHFKGRAATYVGEVPGGINAPASSAQPGAFETLRAALGLGGGVAVGDAVRIEPQGAEALDGVVDYVHPNFLGIRTADSLYRFYGRNAFGMPVGMQIHAFADGVDKDAMQAAWQEWLNGVYA
jgi:uncharacterized protein YndB with AHSA1/START domain